MKCQVSKHYSLLYIYYLLYIYIYIYSHKENQQFELRLMQTNDFAMILAHFVAAASEE